MSVNVRKERSQPFRAMKVVVVALFLMAMVLGCASLAATGWWLSDPSSRSILAMSIVIYMFTLVGTMAFASTRSHVRLVWVLAAALSVLPLAVLFSVFGSPIVP